MFSWSFILTLLFAAFVWAYLKLRKLYSLWSDLGIPGPKPTFIIGNGRDIITNNRSQIDLKWSRQYGTVYGYYMGVFPNLVITDPELIKQVFVRDFHHFVNRFRLNSYHELWNTNLLIAEDEDWKRVRTIVTPAFTSGKLKQMHLLMSKCIDKLIVYFEKVAHEKDGIMVDSKEVFAGFAIDVIASTSFGTETNANDDREKANPIVTNGRRLFSVVPLQAFTALAMPPWFNRLIGNKTLFPIAPFEFFISLTREIVKKRKETNANPNTKSPKRVDLVQLMLEASVDEQTLRDVKYDQLTASSDANESKEFAENSGKSSDKKKSAMLTDNEVIASSILFFNAGFETTSGTILHCCYELAKNQKVQETLYQSIIEATEGLDPYSDQFLDVVINRIPYLEATIMETLRIYPPITILLRRLKTDGYVLGGYRLPKDTAVEASTYSLHHNPKYYPEPETFNPSRFLPENKASLVPYTFFPFGMGPRNCVGMRFALQEIKLLLTSVLQKFRFDRAPGTPDMLEFGKGAPVLLTKTFPLKVVQRQ